VGEDNRIHARRAADRFDLDQALPSETSAPGTCSGSTAWSRAGICREQYPALRPLVG